ncbi:MAG: hypothetical protein RR540_06275, partial [Oscillospiraceae bacterium]
VNLVSPTHYLPWIIAALDRVRGELKIPIVYNSGGYETVETVKMLEGYVDVFLPDLKYFDEDLSLKYSAAKDYFKVASSAILEMFKQVGKVQLDDSGIIKKGVIIRHLTLPNARADTFKIMEWIAGNFPQNEILVSVMSQYTPFFHSGEFKEISRRISTFEYNSVIEKVNDLGLKGFMQAKSSAKEEYTPDFNLEGIF